MLRILNGVGNITIEFLSISKLNSIINNDQNNNFYKFIKNTMIRKRKLDSKDILDPKEKEEQRLKRKLFLVIA